ncbi:MAG: hypothetical protein HFP76_00055 [Methylococcales symbiont of Iophon sp. n. MRB-2018]|nr:MAG: hypothetical protein HFP76_00055 [Methylococcales symbiont of Iophon sp. n. MRB-2018]SMN12577.1 hypothetical protein SPBRAN_1 [uncultured Candidatus Thioglobus sp.]
MKSAFLIALSLAPLVAFSDVSRSTPNLGDRHAQVFASLVQKYCIGFREIPAKLEAALKVGGFNKNIDYDDTFEKYIDRVDYAVTLDQEVCTTDVLLKPASTILFELKQLERFLLSELKLTMSKSKIDYELSSEYKRTKVVKRDYVDEQGKKHSLIFPLENQGEYYMTFDVYWKHNETASKSNAHGTN